MNTTYPKLHGNISDLKNGWFIGELYNQLGELSGHYTIVFKLDGTFKLFKHGDYSNNLVSFNNVEFNGFIDNSILSKETIIKLTDIVQNTIESLQFYKRGEHKKCGTLWVFDAWSNKDLKFKELLSA